MIRAVLFDVGGPLDLEVEFEAALDADIRQALAREGLEPSIDAWVAANRHAVETFAPDAYRAIVWYFLAPDVDAYHRVVRSMAASGAGRDLFELRPGIPGVLEALKEAAMRLGLVANQPLAVLARLERNGIGHFFESAGISGVHGYRKPDPRLFLQVCADLQVEPRDCIMVGDRIDNDIAPARLLGMRTVLIRTGRHREQQARSPDELPDREVEDAEGILEAVLGLIDQKA